MHISREKLPSVLAEILRVLKPGAVGLISVPHGKFEGMHEGKHDTGEKTGCRALCVCWESEDLTKILTNAGFNIIWWDNFEMLNYIVEKRP